MPHLIRMRYCKMGNLTWAVMDQLREGLWSSAARSQLSEEPHWSVKLQIPGETDNQVDLGGGQDLKKRLENWAWVASTADRAMARLQAFQKFITKTM